MYTIKPGTEVMARTTGKGRTWTIGQRDARRVRLVSTRQHAAASRTEEQRRGEQRDEANSGMKGSAKLFADALLEEEESSSSSSSSSSSDVNSAARTARLIASQSEENWTGEESVRDAVLRMLVDKYKPLRGPVIRSAEEKLREKPPVVTSLSPVDDVDEMGEYKPDWQKRAMEPLLPTIEGHRPWHTTFTPPSSTGRVKLGSFNAPSSARRSPTMAGGETLKQDIGAARRNATAQRLGRARESTLDYRLGARSSNPNPNPNSNSSADSSRPMAPMGMKGWASLVEERIERARLEGQFRQIKGRGKPIVREIEERNPFIAREEFLMNRIVQRNQAAPPWVELQSEVEGAIQSFRAILHETWTRRAIRLLTASRPSSSLQSLTLSDVRSLRDAGWVAREAGYHESALGEVNEVVRRYNGVAPYAVRKVFFVREVELEKAYWECGEAVLEGVRERVRRGDVGMGVRGIEDGEDGGGGSSGGVGGAEERRRGVLYVVRAWIKSLRS